MTLIPQLSAIPLVLLLTIGSNAASAITLYSESRDSQAQAVKDAWARVDLKSVIAVPRANLSNLLTQQLAAVAESGTARQTALIQMISLGNSRNVGSDGANANSLFGLLDPILDRHALTGCAELSELSCVANTAGQAEWRRLLLDFANKQSLLEALERRYRRLAKPADCSEADGDADLVEKCKDVVEAGKELQKFNPAAAWVIAQQKADMASRQLADAQKPARALKAEIDNNLNAITDSAGATDSGVTAKVAAAAARLKGNLSTLASLGQNDVFHFELLSQVKQDALNAFLASLAQAKDGAPPAATSPRAAMATVLFSQFFDSTTATLKQTEDAGLAPIVLQKELARMQQEAAAADINARKARVALLQQRAKVLRDQFDLVVQAEQARSKLTSAISLMRADQALLGAKAGSDPKDTQIEDQRMALWLSLGHYLRADAAQAAVAAIDLKLAAADRVAELAYTETNLNAWRSLIDAHVSQLAAWSKAGIKGSDITATAHTLAAWWIAYGVNK